MFRKVIRSSASDLWRTIIKISKVAQLCQRIFQAVNSNSRRLPKIPKWTENFPKIANSSIITCEAPRRFQIPKVPDHFTDLQRQFEYFQQLAKLGIWKNWLDLLFSLFGTGCNCINNEGFKTACCWFLNFVFLIGWSDFQSNFRKKELDHVLISQSDTRCCKMKVRRH